ncbi:MAG: hypothetical protein K6F55_01820 [Eubacterium sp.]|nr:hypothetical protein [Eubacterium sp.]
MSDDSYTEEYTLVSGKCNTVGDLIELLGKIPKDYFVNATGQYDYGIAVDEKNKTVLIDTTDFIEMLLDEQQERTKRAAAEM